MKSIKSILGSLWTWLIIVVLISFIAYIASKSQVKAKLNGTKTLDLTSYFKDGIVDPKMQKIISENKNFTFKGPYKSQSSPQSLSPRQPQSSTVLSVGGEVDVVGGLINVSATGSGVFKQIFVEEGNEVEPGQILAIQENSKEKLALHSAKNNLKLAKIAYKRTEFDLKINTRDLISLKKQYKQDAISQIRLNNSIDQLERTKLALQEQDIRLNNAEISVETAKAALDLSNIRAPVAGYIIKVDAKLGLGTSSINVSNAFVLLPHSQPVVRVEVAEKDMQKIFTGQSVEIMAKSNPKIKYPGTVTKVAQAFTDNGDGNSMFRRAPEDKTIAVVIATPDLPLMIGQTVIVKFKSSGAKADGLSTAKKEAAHKL